MERFEIISRNVIKPSSPTPHNRIHKLSFLDQIKPSIFSSAVFFYISDTCDTSSSSSSSSSSSAYNCLQKYSNILQKSLSKTLVEFYPFAGKLKDDATSIECNDQGAYFIEAQTDSQLLDFLKEPNPNSLNNLLPTSDPNTRELAKTNNAILLVQLTTFNCGGLAIGVSISHKIADASTLLTFVKSWAAITRPYDGEVDPPDFKVGPSLLPALSNIPTEETDRALDAPAGETLVTMRCLFDLAKLANLSAKIHNELNFSPTNVELVSAIIYRCAAAAYQSSTGSSKLSVLVHTVNLRKRMVPPVPENTVGNIIWTTPLLFVEEGKIMELREAIANMRKGLTMFFNEKANRFRGEDGYAIVFETFGLEKELSKVGFNFYSFTSWCKFPFYEMDFGWGKPVWVANGMFFKNIFILLDTKCGQGIEAWVTLEEKQMAAFQKDEELLAFASLNPSVSVISYHD